MLFKKKRSKQTNSRDIKSRLAIKLSNCYARKSHSLPHTFVIKKYPRVEISR